MQVIVRRTSVVFEPLNNHMTSACGGFGRLGVNGLGVRGANGGESKVESHSFNTLRGQKAKHPKPFTMRDASPFMSGAGIGILRSDTPRPFPWPNNIARRKLC